MNIRISNYLKYLLKVYFIGLLIFQIFRTLAFILNWDLVENIPEEFRFSVLLNSYRLGIGYDSIISTYLLILPLFLLLLNHWFFKKQNGLIQTSKWLILILYLLVFFIAVVDVQYFIHFNYRLTTAALMWVENPDFVVSMIFQDYANWLFLLFLLILGVLFSRIIILLTKRSFFNGEELRMPLRLLSVILVCFLTVIGLRGGTAFTESPLSMRDAYFSDYSIANQMALNPVYTFIKSVSQFKEGHNDDLGLMSDEQAIALTKKYLNREGDDYSPIAKKVISEDRHTDQPNVVLVMMEGFTANMLTINGSKFNCSPFLDSLIGQSLFFQQIYSAGIHSHNGILGTLNSHPALFERHALKQLPIQRYNNLPRVLEKHGYNNIYFTTHGLNFDNVGGFLTENGFTKLVSDKNFPKEKLHATLGVPDDFMFEQSISYLNDLDEKDNPFFAAYLTTSNHVPYNFPLYYKRKHGTKQVEGYAYADWALDKFMKLAKKQSWYDNTIFVFIADHGNSLNPTYDLSLSHCYVPLIFFSPKYFPNAEVNTNMGGQIDIFPTLMSMLKLSYVNNTLGINLLEEKRPYIYFNSDNKIGVIDHKYLYIYRKDGPESLHEYYNTENLIEAYASKADSMKKYAFAQMQTSNYLIRKNLVGVEE